MGSEELSLTWDNHQSALIGVFEELLESGTLVDCTIAAEGQYLKAHKVVLSACSPYFQLLFTQENEKNPIVVLKDIKFHELKSLIDFVYRGKVKISKDQLDGFVAAAESLQIKGLAGQHTKTISEKTAKKTAPRRQGRTSPIPRKRRKGARSSTSEVNHSPPSNDNSNESNVPGDLVSHETHVSVKVPTKSSLIVPKSPCGSATCTSNTQQDQHVTETISSASRELTSSPEAVLPDIETVIKTEPEPEPEPLTEIFLPEPKNEEYVDDMALLESGDGSSEGPTEESQRNTNDYSDFQGFDTSENSFVMTQMTDHSDTQGAVARAVAEDVLTNQGEAHRRGVLFQLLTAPTPPVPLLPPTQSPPLPAPHLPTERWPVFQQHASSSYADPLWDSEQPPGTATDLLDSRFECLVCHQSFRNARLRSLHVCHHHRRTLE